MVRAHRPDLPAEQVRRWVDLRMARQDLLKRDDPPAFEVVLEECALRRPVGGSNAMREQLKHLLEVATLPSLTLHILPLNIGEHAAMSGAFTIYRFAEQPDSDVVYLEHTTSDLYAEDRDEVARYSAAFERLRAAALSPRRSVQFLHTLVDEA